MIYVGGQVEKDILGDDEYDRRSNGNSQS